MRILFLLQRFPYPPVAGGAWQSFNLIKHLAPVHECHILSFADEGDEPDVAGFHDVVPNARVLGVFPHQQSLARPIDAATYGFKTVLKRLLPRACVPTMRAVSYVWRYCIGERIGAGPYAEYKRRDFARAVAHATATGGYDVVHVETIMLAQYRACCGGVPAVASPYDAMAPWADQFMEGASGLELASWRVCAWALRAHERHVYRGFETVCVVSGRERRRLLAINPALDAEAVPISVDDAFFENGHAAAGGPIRPRRRLFIPASWKLTDDGASQALGQFLREGFQTLRRQHDVEAIVSHAPAAGPTLAALAAIPGVVMAGWVDDYVGAMRDADVVVCTDHTHNGVKSRVVQAMALGKPVVASRAAASGLDAVDGLHLWIGDTPAEMAKAIDGLLRDLELAERTGAAARDFARSHFSIGMVGARWEALYARTIAKGRAALLKDRLQRQ